MNMHDMVVMDQFPIESFEVQHVLTKFGPNGFLNNLHMLLMMDFLSPSGICVLINYEYCLVSEITME